MAAEAGEELVRTPRARLEERAVLLDTLLGELRDDLGEILGDLQNPLTMQTMEPALVAEINGAQDVEVFFATIAEILDLEAAIGSVNIGRLEQLRVVREHLAGLDNPVDDPVLPAPVNPEKPMKLEQFFEQLAMDADDPNRNEFAKLLRAYKEAKKIPRLKPKEEFEHLRRYRELKIETLAMILNRREAVMALAALCVPTRLFAGQYQIEGRYINRPYQYFTSMHTLDVQFPPFALLEDGYVGADGARGFGEDGIKSAIRDSVADSDHEDLDLSADGDLIDFDLNQSEVCHLILQYCLNYLEAESHVEAAALIPAIVAKVMELKPGVALIQALGDFGTQPDEEWENIEAMREIQDIFLLHFLNNVIYSAKPCVHRGDLTANLAIQIGRNGLVRAMDTFEFRGGKKFYAYARTMITAALMRGAGAESNQLGVTHTDIEKLKAFRRARAIAFVLHEGDVTSESIREVLVADGKDWKIEEVERLAELDRVQHMTSIEASRSLEDDRTILDTVAADTMNPEEELIERERDVELDVLIKAAKLTYLQEVVIRRMLAGENQGEIAATMTHTKTSTGEAKTYSRARIGQLYQHAMKKLERARVRLVSDEI